MLMAKCCHDVDWLGYLVDRPALRVSSFGGLQHFTAGQPAGRSGNPVPGLCGRAGLPVLGQADLSGSRRRSRRPALAVVGAGGGGRMPSRSPKRCASGPYGRCVYDCDNDVVDHQVVNIEYAGGVTASLTMTGFTPMAFRKTRIFGTRGMLEGDGYTVSVFDFLTGTTTTTAVVDPDDPVGRGWPSRRGRRADPGLPGGGPRRRSEPNPHLARGQPAQPCRRLGRRTRPAPRNRRADCLTASRRPARANRTRSRVTNPGSRAATWSGPVTARCSRTRVCASITAQPHR